MRQIGMMPLAMAAMAMASAGPIAAPLIRREVKAPQEHNHSREKARRLRQMQRAAARQEPSA